MQRRSEAALQVTRQLLDGAFSGQLRPGDQLEMWTFNESVNTAALPVAEWTAASRPYISVRVMDLIRRLPYQKRPRLEWVVPELNRVIRESPWVTVILVGSGESELRGTSVDEAVNEACRQWRAEQQKARMPIVTFLRARQGAITDWSVTPAPWPLQLPPPPPETIAASSAPSSAAAPPPARAAPTPPATNPPPTATASTQTKTNPPAPRVPAPARAAPTPPATNPPPTATASTQTKTNPPAPRVPAPARAAPTPPASDPPAALPVPPPLVVSGRKPEAPAVSSTSEATPPGATSAPPAATVASSPPPAPDPRPVDPPETSPHERNSPATPAAAPFVRSDPLTAPAALESNPLDTAAAPTPPAVPPLAPLIPPQVSRPPAVEAAPTPAPALPAVESPASQPWFSSRSVSYLRENATWLILLLLAAALSAYCFWRWFRAQFVRPALDISFLPEPGSRKRLAPPGGTPATPSAAPAAAGTEAAGAASEAAPPAQATSRVSKA
jgi:hypothetical protein